MSEADADMFVVLYRWRIKSGHEAQFADAWGQATRELLLRGSLGSRLHRGDDGLWYGYAQWPSEAVRAAAFTGPGTSPGARMRAAIEESMPETRLTPVVDYLQAPNAAAGG